MSIIVRIKIRALGQLFQNIWEREYLCVENYPCSRLEARLSVRMCEGKVRFRIFVFFLSLLSLSLSLSPSIFPNAFVMSDGRLVPLFLFCSSDVKGTATGDCRALHAAIWLASILLYDMILLCYTLTYVLVWFFISSVRSWFVEHIRQAISVWTHEAISHISQNVF